MMAKGSDKGEQRLSRRVTQLLGEHLVAYIANPTAAMAARDSSAAALPEATRANIDAVLAYNAPSYREVFLIQAAYGLCQQGLDLGMRQDGARSVGAAFSRLLRRNHIRATADAFQNIGKNDPNLRRGNVREYDQLLMWATKAGHNELSAAFHYALTCLALTARPVLPMPELAPARLTFFNTARLLETVLGTPSGGAHEQFSVAACLEALIEEFGLGGIAGLRVETKPITASDTSSKVAGDIQIKRGNRTEEAIEVSAADWRLKLDQAVAAIRVADLPRAHVLAAVREGTIANESALRDLGADVSVIDVGAFLRLLVAVMRKPARAAALRRLYELLDRNQPNTDLVNAYVDLIKQHGLAA